MTLRTLLPDAIHHLLQTIIFTVKRLWKTPNLTYLAAAECQLANLFANRDWQIVTVLNAPA